MLKREELKKGLIGKHETKLFTRVSHLLDH